MNSSALSIISVILSFCGYAGLLYLHYSYPKLLPYFLALAFVLVNAGIMSMMKEASGNDSE